MRDDEVVFSIHRCLEVVADNPSAPAAAVHGPGIRIGQGYLMIGCRFDLRGHLLQEPHLATQAGDLLTELIHPSLGHVAGFPIGTVEGREIPLDAGLHLLDPLGRPGAQCAPA